MATAGDLVVKISATSNQFNKDMQAAGSELKNFGNTAQASGNKAASAFQLTSVFAKFQILRKLLQPIGKGFAQPLKMELKNIQKGLTNVGRTVGELVAPILKPISEAFASKDFQDIMESVKGAFSGALSGIKDFVFMIVDFGLQLFGGEGFLSALKWEDIKNIIIETFIKVEFVLRNFKAFFLMSMAASLLSIVEFSNEISHILTVAIPAYITWFMENWKTMWSDWINFNKTIWQNFWSNITNVWGAITTFFKTGVLGDFNWQPLVAGFKPALKELPKIAKRELSDLEKQLKGQVNQIADALRKDLPNFMQKRKDEIAGKPKGEAPGIEFLLGGAGVAALMPVAGQDKFQTAKAALKGTQDARDAIKAAKNQGLETEQKKTNKVLGLIEKHLEAIKKNIGADVDLE